MKKILVFKVTIYQQVNYDNKIDLAKRIIILEEEEGAQSTDSIRKLYEEASVILSSQAEKHCVDSRSCNYIVSPMEFTRIGDDKIIILDDKDESDKDAHSRQAKGGAKVPREPKDWSRDDPKGKTP